MQAKDKEDSHMILYFSGTGNSAYVAEKIAAAVKDETLSINDRIRSKSTDEIISKKPLVFVTPTYAWRIPKLVETWMRKVSFNGNKKVYFVMTCGEDNGNAQNYLKILCSETNLEYMGCASVVMPENYIAMFPVPKESEARAIIKAAHPVIERTAGRIKAGKRLGEKNITLKDKITSSIVNRVFYPLCVKDRKFYATDACISCGKCANVCPLNNVKLKEGKPTWNGTCTHCMACICSCPKEAIEYGNASKGKPRYQVPKNL